MLILFLIVVVCYKLHFKAKYEINSSFSLSCLINTALNLPLLKEQLNNMPRPKDKLLFMECILLELPEIIINVIFVIFSLKPKLYSMQIYFDND